MSNDLREKYAEIILNKKRVFNDNFQHLKSHACLHDIECKYYGMKRISMVLTDNIIHISPDLQVSIDDNCFLSFVNYIFKFKSFLLEIFISIEDLEKESVKSLIFEEYILKFHNHFKSKDEYVFKKDGTFSTAFENYMESLEREE